MSIEWISLICWLYPYWCNPGLILPSLLQRHCLPKFSAVHKNPQVLFSKATPQLVICHPACTAVWDYSINHLMCKTLHICNSCWPGLLVCEDLSARWLFLLAYSTCLPSLVWSTHLVSKHLVLSSTSFIKMLNSIRSNINL